MKYFWILMFAAAMVYAQMNLNGSIVDADFKGIPDVTVTAPEYGLTAMSDSNGKFTIVSSTEATGIRNYSTQSTSIDPNGNYRIFVPNGARRLLPFSAISGLRDGIYYLAQGRSYRAQIKVMVMNGRIVSQAPVREVSAAESTQMNLRKASTTTTLNLTRPGVVDTTLIVNPLSGKIEMIVPRSGPTQANVTQLDPALDRRDGHEYQVIQVGDQSWFAENLAYDPGAAGNSWCTQNNDCESYGRLYDYATAKTACPAGWRLPSDDDWNTLQAFIKTNYTDTATNFWRSSPKTANLGLSPAIWLSGTPTSVLGFQALPSGVWNPYKTTERFFGSGAFFWSSTATDTNASARVLLGTKDGVFNYTYPQKMGMSVRCVQVPQTLADIPAEWPEYCHKALGNCGILYDRRNGKEYRWTKIGEQKWMAENLNYGTRIDGALDQTDDNIVEKYCYNNLNSMCEEYGGLYQWHEAMGLDDSCMTKSCAEQVKTEHQGICPAGFIVPNKVAWDELLLVLKKNNSLETTLKSMNLWETVSNDDYGFSALPTGEFSTSVRSYSLLGYTAPWWSSSLENQKACNPIFERNNTSLLFRNVLREYGFSLRCIAK